MWCNYSARGMEMKKRIVLDIDSNRLLPKYLYYMLMSKKPMFDRLYTGSVQKCMTTSMLNSIFKEADIPVTARYLRKDEPTKGKILIQPVGQFNLELHE